VAVSQFETWTIKFTISSNLTPCSS
jgi:hypothetical protein